MKSKRKLNELEVIKSAAVILVKSEFQELIQCVNLFSSFKN